MKKKDKEEKISFYSIANLIKSCPSAKYFMAYGLRSNGKTFQALKVMLWGFHEGGININGYFDDGSRGVLIRRFREDFNGGNAIRYWIDNFIENKYEGNILEKLTKGKWNNIVYYQRAFYLEHIDPNDDKNNIREDHPFCYTTAISEQEHFKGGGIPRVGVIVFDEFIARGYYLPDEFILLSNTLKTCIRSDDKPIIIMVGNSINKYSPYFDEMGLYKVKNQKKGTIDVYEYGSSGLKVAVEYTDVPSKKNKSDIYFAFDNPKLKMITTGDWEIAMYPHLPHDYCAGNILYKYFIEFDGDILQCEIIYLHVDKEPPMMFTYIHRKTTPIKEDGISLVYCKNWSPLRNHARKINNPRNELEKKIWGFFQSDNVYYQDNTVGEIVRNYVMWCDTDSLRNM